MRWGTQERLSYRAADGLGLDGLLILPPGRQPRGQPVPAGHAGARRPFDRHADGSCSPAPAGAVARDRGYAVFLPNPRGGKGHGRDFAAAVAGRSAAPSGATSPAGSTC